MCRDGGPETASEHDDATRVDVLAARHRIADRQRVGGERGFAGLALARAVTAIVEAHDRPLARPARVGQGPRDFLGIASEVDHRGRRRGRPFDDPAAKTRAVGGDDLQRRGARRQVRRRGDDRLRKEDQALLREPR